MKRYGAKKGWKGMYKTINWKKTPIWRPRSTSRRPDVVMQDKPLPMYRPLNRRTGGFLGMEKKFQDSFKTSTPINNAWTGGELDPAANCLYCPTKGTGPSNRDGDHTVIKQIQIRAFINFTVDQDSNDVVGPYAITLALVLDKQCNGSAINAEDVFVDTSPKQLGFRNLQYTRRFVILRAQRIVLNPSTAFTDGANTGSVGGTGRLIEWTVNCNIPVDHVGDAGSVADISNNALHLIGCGNTTTTGSINYACRVRFVG